jgi:hypothetical protein
MNPLPLDYVSIADIEEFDRLAKEDPDDNLSRSINAYFFRLRHGHLMGKTPPEPEAFLGQVLDSISNVPPANSTTLGSLGINFIASILAELRQSICGKGKKKFKPIGQTSNATISGLAAFIMNVLHVHSAAATGIAILILLTLAKAVKNSFCRMTDNQVLQALQKMST